MITLRALSTWSDAIVADEQALLALARRRNELRESTASRRATRLRAAREHEEDLLTRPLIPAWLRRDNGHGHGDSPCERTVG